MAMDYTRRVRDTSTIVATPANAQATWWVKQDNPGEWKEPTSAGTVKCVARVNVDRTQTLHDNEEYALTRSPRGKIGGRYEALGISLEQYMRLPAACAEGATVTTNPAQADDLFQIVFGEVAIVNSQDIDDVTDVVSHDILTNSTVVEVADSSLYAVGDAVRVMPPTGTGQDIGEGEIAFISAIDDGGADRLTFSPMLRCFPQLTPVATTIQGVRVFRLTNAREGFASGRVSSAEGIGWQLTDFRPDSVTIAPSGTEPLKCTIEGSALAGIACGRTHAVANATNTNHYVDVLTAEGVEVGAYVTLRKITVATGALADDEQALLVISRDTTSTPNRVTFERACGITATVAPVVTSTQEQAGAGGGGEYVLTTKRNLKLRIDHGPWIVVDCAGGTPALTTPLEAVNAINAAFAFHPEYGSLLKGEYGTTSYATIAEVASSKVRLHSRFPGSQGGIEVAVYGDGSTSAHDVIFTGAFAIAPTHDVHLIPYVPAETTVGADPIHGWDGIMCVGGFRVGIDSWSLKVSNADEVQNKEIVQVQGPTGILAGKTRVYELTTKGKVTDTIGHYFEAEKGRASKQLKFQVGGVRGGAAMAVLLQNCILDEVTMSEDGAMLSAECKWSVMPTAANDDEVILAMCGPTP